MTEWLPERVAAAEREAGTSFDLAACVREPIHRLGGVQSYGALLAVAGGRVAVASENAGTVLGLDELAGAPIERVIGARHRESLWALADTEAGQTAMMPLEIGSRRFDVTVHRSGEHVVLEFEPASDTPGYGTLYAPVRHALTRLQRAGTVVEACQAAVREV